MKTCTKKAYTTEAHAQADLGKLKALYKAKQVPDWKNLNTYQCPDCDFFHLGHSFKTFRKAQQGKATSIPAPKVPSHGELRRKLARLENSMDKRRRYQVQEIGKIVARDREQMAEDEQAARIIAAWATDLADSIAAAHRMSERHFR